MGGEQGLSLRSEQQAVFENKRKSQDLMPIQKKKDGIHIQKASWDGISLFCTRRITHAKCHDRHREVHFLAFKCQGMNRPDEPLSFRTWASTAKLLKPLAKQQVDKPALGTEDLF